MLSPAETVVTLELMVTATTVVARPALERRLRLHVEVTPRTLDDVVYRLRRRLRPLGLDLFVARGRGFSLDARLDWPIDEAVVLT
jgi:DNA-binding response OmpR family regulator